MTFEILIGYTIVALQDLPSQQCYITWLSSSNWEERAKVMLFSGTTKYFYENHIFVRILHVILDRFHLPLFIESRSTPERHPNVILPQRPVQKHDNREVRDYHSPL